MLADKHCNSGSTLAHTCLPQPAAQCPLKNTPPLNATLPTLQCTRPYLEGVLPRPAAKSAAAALLAKCDSTERSDSSSDDEEGQDLCNCEFSLAYGAHTRQLCMNPGFRVGGD
jgi:hypothetical protein